MPNESRPSIESQGSQTRFNMAKSVEHQKRKRVLVVGAGAAGMRTMTARVSLIRMWLTQAIGMSAAHHLSNHPDKFDVTVVDTVDYCGGQAFSISVDKEKTGASWLNQGVQGGSYIFHHTMTMFARCGYWADPVKLHVSFGKGEQFWSNVYPTKLLKKHEGEVRRFYSMLKIVRTFEILFALLPVKLLVKLFRFSEEFANLVALPMIALFLGTGNYATEVPTIMLERLCTSPTYGMWYPPDKASIVSKLPPMVVFPNFSEFYETWRQKLVSRGVNVRLSTKVTGVIKRDSTGVTVRTKPTNPKTYAYLNGQPDKVRGDTSSDETRNQNDDVESTEHYDEIILCVLTDAAKALLQPSITGMESRILGSAKFADDITVTHQDVDYMKRHYEIEYNADLAVSSISGTDQSHRTNWAKDNFKPMYLILPYQQDLTKLEMCFDCTNYQSQFPPDVPQDKHVFQTIFLNNQRDSHLWTLDEIKEDKIIRKDWWHQLCHSWTHYLFLVPWMWLLQGKRHTRFAASWTLVNAHEVAVMSGIAAAVDLGATYPEDLERDKFSFLAWRLYYLLVYGRWYRRNVTKKGSKHAEGEGKDWATENEYGSTYAGPGVNSKEERLCWKNEVKKGRSVESF